MPPKRGRPPGQGTSAGWKYTIATGNLETDTARRPSVTEEPLCLQALARKLRQRPRRKAADAGVPRDPRTRRSPAPASCTDRSC